ncbi:type II secretion system F family protein [Rhodococcus sp. NPDC057014]|uniref:type II secretion system F family protein n=1 Tax=Rhodococcus sp. NPDC057014 TaxID=3346000 RepID=UPI0036453E4A
MSIQMTVILYTSVGTIGIYLVALYIMRAQPALSDAMARLSGPAPERTATTGTSLIDGMANKLGIRVHPYLQDSKFFTLPNADLALLHRDPAHVLGEKLVAALLGLLIFPFLNLVLTAFGVGLGWSIPAILSIATAFLLFLIPDIEIRRRATAARAEFAQALSSYIDLVALCRRGGIGTTQSLERAAQVGDSWVFLRLDEELYEAGRSGEAPWNALTRVSQELGLTELGDLADIMNMTGDKGASVYTSLRAKAAGLRSAQASAEQGAAAEATEKLAMPLAGLAGLFIMLLLIPALTIITG